MQQLAQTIPSTYTFPPLILPTHKFKFKSKTKTHLQINTISAKWGKRRSGSQRSRKFILNSIAYIASTLKILPEPFDTLMREFWLVGGGNGNGNFGFRNGFGGGGGGDGKSRKKDKLGFWVLLLISSGLALWVVLEKEKGRESELGFWVLLVFVSAFAVYCLVKGRMKEIKDWVLGFSCGAALMGLGLKNNENFVKLVDGFRVNFSNFLGIPKRKRSRRWI